MNFSELKKLIKEIKDTVTCRECDNKFKDKDIRIIGTVIREGFFLAHCSLCKNTMIINVVFRDKNRKHRHIQKKTPINIISKNDILDMRNFLKEFDGDFINLFNKKK